MRLLLAALLLVLVLSTVGTAIAIQQGLPAEFGGRGDPDNVAGEFVTRGTAMSPPLAPLLVLVGLAAVSFARGWPGRLALAAMIVVAALFAIGGVAEPNDPAGSDLPAALHVGLKFLGVAASIAMGAFAVPELFERFRARA